MREIVTREDEIIYADCTNVIIERDTRAEITRRLENYDIIARTRNVEINWDAAKYQQRKKGNKERSTQLQRPLTKIKIGATEKIIGKEIATQKTGRIAISGGFRKSGNTRWAFVRVCVCVWGATEGDFFAGNALAIKIKLTLWGALVRSTISYGLQTIQLTEHDRRRVNGFTFN